MATTAAISIIKNNVEINRPTPHKDQSVYIMRDKNSLKVSYVGRTNDPVRRQKEHERDVSKRNLLSLEVVATGLTKNEARVLEQAIISAYTVNMLQNKRREIAPHNIFKFQSDVGRIASLWSGLVESELLCLMEG